MISYMSGAVKKCHCLPMNSAIIRLSWLVFSTFFRLLFPCYERASVTVISIINRDSFLSHPRFRDDAGDRGP